MSALKRYVHTSARFPKEVLQRWSILIEGLDISAEEFYADIEERFLEKEIEGIEIIATSQSEFAGLGNKRLYLRIKQREMLYDVCGMPYGKNIFYAGYWHGFLRFHGATGVLLRIGLLLPVIGSYIDRQLSASSYFNLDTLQAFQEMCHRIVTESVSHFATEAGITPPTKEEIQAGKRSIEKVGLLNF